MVEAIKNNGDQVVDTCVQDDTLNTTVTRNCPLATVSQTLVLGANDGVTSDLVVPVISLDLATIEDSGQANKVQQCEENLDQISESSGNTKLQQLDCTNPTRKDKMMNCEDKVSRKVVCSNTFDALMINSDQEPRAKKFPMKETIA
ncbi:hypothetical protein R3W88_032000 [Solanum pinnatisectum]|uniref:Uncharacterized protein n=1 Tax=Solanum pinnatisectum TaxID=50273 RepID=A0AAV9LNJ5_9SOLN|nr:hypothetical protein R3W88_032000 [Solanum pinnatisectum]